MKKSIIIFFLFGIYQSFYAQNVIKTTTACSDEVLYQTPGRWLKNYNGLLDYSESLHLTAAQKKEILNRMDAIHQMMLTIYPQPRAIDAVWHHSIGYATFAEQVRYVRNNQGILNREAVVEKPVASFNYTSAFFRYECNRNSTNEILRGYPGETGTWIYVYANQLVAAKEITMDDGAGLGTTGGYPVCQRQPLIKQLGNFELLGTPDKKERWVIIHRNGMLPYIPVTRKQYLDMCIGYIKREFEKNIKLLRESSLPYDDKDNRDIREQQITNSINARDAALKRHQDELEKNRAEGTLELPAIVTWMLSALMSDVPVFVSENDGVMLVTENPDYMRKDLPKYVPQFFIVKWTWDEWPPQADMAKLIEERFPFDKLQAMIDK